LLFSFAAIVHVSDSAIVEKTTIILVYLRIISYIKEKTSEEL